MKKINGQILIIGAGACGLMAAKELSAKGYGVTILEADNHVGGRIHTITDASFNIPLKTGAEFIHGKFPETFNVLYDATIAFNKVEGKHFQEYQGNWKPLHDVTEGWDKLIKEMKQLEEDIPLRNFLDINFPGDEYVLLCSAVRHYAEALTWQTLIPQAL